MFVKKLIFPVFRIFPDGRHVYLKTFDDYFDANDFAQNQLKYLDFGVTKDCQYSYHPTWVDGSNEIIFCNRNLKLITRGYHD